MTLIQNVDSIESPETTGSPIPQAILHAQSVSAYIHGNSWPTFGPYSAARPDLTAIGWIVSISLRVQGLPPGLARCGDFEQGGMDNSDVGVFLHLADRRWGLPWLYCAASNTQDLVNEAAAQGWRRNTYYVWSAHYGAGEHICGPGTCGYAQADGTQWSDSVPENCDESILQDYMLPSLIPPTPLPEDVMSMVIGKTPKGLTELFVLDKNGQVWHTWQVETGGWVGAEAGKRNAAWYSLGTPGQ